MKSEIKMLRDRDREVKILENSWQFWRNEILQQNYSEEEEVADFQDTSPIGVSIDYTWRADDLEEDLDEAEYEDIDDMEGESEEE